MKCFIPAVAFPTGPRPAANRDRLLGSVPRHLPGATDAPAKRLVSFYRIRYNERKSTLPRAENIQAEEAPRAPPGEAFPARKEQAMTAYDEPLRQLQAQCARKKKLEASAGELRTQRDAYARRAEECRQRLSHEEADVERLERPSLASFVYNILGKKEEKLSKEQREAYAAQIQCDAAVREWRAAEEELQQCEAELRTLQGCEERYAALLREKTRAVKAAGGETAEAILRLEERAGYLTSQKQELQEAVQAGNIALDCADHILSELDSAEGWGTWDLLGGGLLTDLAKHSHLDDAQASVEALQTQLRHFRTELADVTIDADLQVSIDGFLRVADYLFDGILADWAVLDQIRTSQDQVQHTRSQILDVLRHLHSLQDQAEAEQARIAREIEQLVNRA